jgi:hypothetical protein
MRKETRMNSLWRLRWEDYDFRTEQGWFHIEYNGELSILFDDHMGCSEMFD